MPLAVPQASSDETDVDNLLAGLRTGTWLDSQVFPPLSYHVDGIIPEGLSLLVGPPKIGKSWFTLAVLLAVASGGHALGRIPVKPRPVFYLGLEDGDRRLQDRCRTLLGDAPIPARFQYMTAIQPGTVIAVIDKWLDAFGNDRPLIVLDTLGKVMPPSLVGESAYQRDYRVGSTLKRTVDRWPGSALTVVHHDRKAGSEDFVDSVSGTHGLAGAADTLIVLARDRHSTGGLIHVTGRDVAEGEYAVEFTGGSQWVLDGRTLAEAAARVSQRKASENLDERARQILMVVSDNPGGITPKQVGEILDLDAKTAGVYLGRLADTGRIVRLSRGSYTPVVSVVSVENTPPDSTLTTHTTRGHVREEGND